MILEGLEGVDWRLVVIWVFALTLIDLVCLLIFLAWHSYTRNAEIKYRLEVQKLLNSYTEIEQAMEKRFWWYKSKWLRDKRKEG